MYSVVSSIVACKQCVNTIFQVNFALFQIYRVVILLIHVWWSFNYWSCDMQRQSVLEALLYNRSIHYALSMWYIYISWDGWLCNICRFPRVMWHAIVISYSSMPKSSERCLQADYADYTLFKWEIPNESNRCWTFQDYTQRERGLSQSIRGLVLEWETCAANIVPFYYNHC